MIGKMKALALAAAVLCGLASMSASAEWLTAGQTLNADQSLTSHDGRYTAIMQGDGNFVVYRNSDGVAIWNTGTSGSGANRIVMQTDGNLVIYTPDGRAVWNTGTWQSGSQANQFTVDDDGTAVVVAYAPVWSTSTATPGSAPGLQVEFKYGDSFTQGQAYNAGNGYQWIFQTDGNLVLYHNGVVTWASNSGAAQYARFDGNLVTWKNGTYSYVSPMTQIPSNLVYQNGSLTLNADASHFVVQSDGNAVIYRAFRIWGSTPGTPATSSGTSATILIFKTWGGTSTAEQAINNAVASANLECQTYYKKGAPVGLPISQVTFDTHFSQYTANVEVRCQYVK
ncbi:hypothetical protein [Luteibacter sp. RCC_6_2]|uniref:hypothetical protein n=1 Tax=Luteibacter sp. RCC_6_2 TaxID=3239223 RepID=UPI0035254352